MLKIKDFEYLILAKDDLFKWVKDYLLWKKKVLSVAWFLFKNIIYRFSLYERLIIDEGKENKLLVVKMIKKYDI